MFTSIWAKIKDIWTNHKWKVIGGLVVILLIFLAYGCGRYKSPAKVVEREKIVTKTEIQWKEKVVDHDVIKTVEVEKKVYVKVKDENKDVHTIIVYRTLPDGSKETKVETIDKTKTETTTGNRLKKKALK